MSDASPMVKTVKVKLDQERTMRLTLGDALAFKRATTTQERPKGISLIRGDLAREEMAEEEWLELFAIMLRHDDSEMTAERVGEIMDVGGFVRAGEAFEELLADFKAEKEAGPAAVGPTASGS